MADNTPSGPRGPAILARPWFWFLFVGALFSIPLIKGIGAEFPDPLPGLESTPLEFELPTETGEVVHLSDLAGYLVIASELPLANGAARELAMKSHRSLRRRLRGLGSAVVFVVLCHGGAAKDLTALLDKWTARRPVNVFLLDTDREVMDDLRHAGGSASADWFLLDRYGRMRGAYGVSAPEFPMDDRAETRRLVAMESEIDRLVLSAGQLANWAGSDTPPGQP